MGLILQRQESPYHALFLKNLKNQAKKTRVLQRKATLCSMSLKQRFWKSKNPRAPDESQHQQIRVRHQYFERVEQILSKMCVRVGGFVGGAGVDLGHQRLLERHRTQSCFHRYVSVFLKNYKENSMVWCVFTMIFEIIDLPRHVPKYPSLATLAKGRLSHREVLRIRAWPFLGNSPSNYFVSAENIECHFSNTPKFHDGGKRKLLLKICAIQINCFQESEQTCPFR